MSDPLRVDPTRTTTLRLRFIAEMRRRFAALDRAIWDLVVTDDAFGLKERPLLTPHSPIFNTRWRFVSDRSKVVEFRSWLEERVDSGILESDDTESPWMGKYVGSAYKQGVLRAYEDAHVEDMGESVAFRQGSRSEFLRSSFALPETTKKLQLLYTRAFTSLKGLTDQQAARLTRELADGLAHGQSPRDIARTLRKTIGVSKSRAATIARTEIIHAHAEGQLDAFEAMGIEEVSVMVEWLTAGDSRVCGLCGSMGGMIMTIEEARGMIPRHPNCRCCFMPSDVRKRSKPSAAQRDRLIAAIKKSARAEIPGAKTREALRRSRWVGADLPGAAN